MKWVNRFMNYFGWYKLNSKLKDCTITLTQFDNVMIIVDSGLENCTFSKEIFVFNSSLNSCTITQLNVV